jgi:hypothetical protein
MPITVFSLRGILANRRERIEAVVAGGKRTRKPHEAWIAVDPYGTVRVLMTGPDGFERRARRGCGSPSWSGLRWRTDYLPPQHLAHVADLHRRARPLHPDDIRIHQCN